MSKPIASSTLGLLTGSSTRLLSASIRQPVAVIASTAGFHSSAAVEARGGVSRYVKSLRRIQKHYARQLQKPKPEVVDPVLGRANVPFMERLKAKLGEPTNMSFGLNTGSAEKLLYGAEHATLLRQSEIDYETVVDLEKSKREATHRIVSMQNAGQQERKKFAKKFAAEEFARFEGDTGSSEVQAAISTVQIHFLVNHMKEHKGDNLNMRKLQMLVQGRQGILKYLRRSNPERYYWAIEKLGLNDDAVTAEFSLSRRYLEQYQFFGQNTLRVKDNKKERAHKVKMARLEKKAQKFMN